MTSRKRFSSVAAYIRSIVASIIREVAARASPFERSISSGWMGTWGFRYFAMMSAA